MNHARFSRLESLIVRFPLFLRWDFVKSLARGLLGARSLWQSLLRGAIAIPAIVDLRAARADWRLNADSFCRQAKCDSSTTLIITLIRMSVLRT